MLTLFIASSFASEITGYSEFRASYSADVDGTPWSVVERFRPTLEAELNDRMSLSVTVEANMSHGRWDAYEAWALVDYEIGSILDNAGCGFPEPKDRYSSIDDILGVERLFLDIYTDIADIRVGRQALNWGSAQMLNPTDLFAEVLVAEPWKERSGVNAVRANVSLGEVQVAAVAAIDDSLSTAQFGLRPTINIMQTDVSPVASIDSEGENFVGLDLRGQMGVGWWLEGGSALGADEGLLPKVSVGADYSFDILQGLMFGAQYTYDATGVEDPRYYQLSDRGVSMVPVPDCDAAAEMFANVEGGDPRFTIGQHYGLGWARLTINDEWGFTATGLTNLQDYSTLLIPNLAWTPGGNWSVNAGAQLLLGEGEFSPTVHMTNVTFGEGASGATVDFDGVIPTWSAFVWARYSI